MITLEQIKEQLREGNYTFPGCYPKYFVTWDGMPLSFIEAKNNFAEICRAHITQDTNSGWYLAGVDINWEDEDLRCIHSNKKIECAYPSDEMEEIDGL